MELAIVKKTIVKDGKSWTNYYIRTENGNFIAIKPCFKQDWASLKVIAIALN